MNPLRKYRRASGMNQLQFAAKVGISSSRICAFEKNRALPTEATAHKIASLLGIKPEALFPRGYSLRYDYRQTGQRVGAREPYLPPMPPVPVRQYPSGPFKVHCQKCGEEFWMRADDREMPIDFDGDPRCPSCAMPVRDVIPITGEANV